MKKIILWTLGGILALIAAIFTAQIVASEIGEVVVLTTTDAAGEAAETRLWVVDHEGSQWLRTKAGGSGWSGRLLASEVVTIERAGVAASYHGVAVVEKSAAINGLMSDKYGLSDSYISLLLGSRDGSIAIRLDPQ
jgi:hypothetical protein